MDNTAEELQTEVEFYRENQSAVEREIRAVIADNQKLSKQVGALLQEKIENARNSHDFNVEELVELKKQVNLLTKERDSLHVLWQTSQKTIDALETELKTYQGYDGRTHHKSTEEKISTELKLETALNDYLDLESKHKELNLKHTLLEKELQNKETEIVNQKTSLNKLELKYEESQKVFEEYRINLAIEKKANEDLRGQLALCQNDCVSHVKKEAEAKAKVAEALQLFDVVSAQKDEALKSLAETTDELTKLQHTLEAVRNKTEMEFRKENDDVKDKYNEKIADMLEHIRHLDKELIEKGFLLNKAHREIKILQLANQSYLEKQNEYLKTIDPKLAAAEQRMEAMFQELFSSERRNIQLVSEKQSLAMDMQRIQDLHAREIKRLQWEETLLRTECKELRSQVKSLQISLEETHDMVNKLQTILSSNSELNQKMVATKEEELIELNKHIEKQMELNKKWKDSYVEMSEKLKKRLNLLQKENDELKSKIKSSAVISSNNDVETSSEP